jgi:protein-S-isoprenylcysteine O-methyltransferase Ste14
MRWSNIPVPEGHLTSLMVGVALQLLFPRRLFRSVWFTRALGWLMLLAGSLGVGWAVSAAREVDLNRPSQLVVAGPYRFSRNPMYIAWTVLYIATAILVNTRWPLLLLPALLTHMHYFVVLREERFLEQAHGDQYRLYCHRVRRY